MSCGERGLDMAVVPAGYRFSPSDKDLENFGSKLPVNVIPLMLMHQAQINSLWDDDDDTILVDGGCYEIDPDSVAPITWEGKIVGYVKTLDFYQGSPPNGTETKWMVEEFGVNLEFVPVDKADHSTQEKVIEFTCLMYGNVLHLTSNLVACKISRVLPEPEWHDQVN
ncbi:unnamed protein product [Dovyalis caffra]|uniref:Uncharacterized protein n=1 Tax=Dovyalis caffra TaxID=77055 RepID=A0AAV1RT12_9ROSI|nr:unnamed protein product [Dovyalis caffra]